MSKLASITDELRTDKCRVIISVRSRRRATTRSRSSSSSAQLAFTFRRDKHANKLIDSEPKVRFAQLPVLWITGTLASAGASKTAYYTCPCYKAPRRTGLNFVTSVDLRVEENPSKWVLRGVALLTSTE